MTLNENIFFIIDIFIIFYINYLGTRQISNSAHFFNFHFCNNMTLCYGMILWLMIELAELFQKIYNSLCLEKKNRPKRLIDQIRAKIICPLNVGYSLFDPRYLRATICLGPFSGQIGTIHRFNLKHI